MWNREQFAGMFRPPLIGVVHLPPLPDSPGWLGDLAAVERSTLDAVAALVNGGVGGVVLENFHDSPFYPAAVPAPTIAAMSALALLVRRRHPDLTLGVNVLRNDAAAALAVAHAAGAQFIRVNVHGGSVVTDQGLIQGQAHATVRLRRQLQADVGILADLQVKHGRPLVPRPITEEADDLRNRAWADALIVTGPATGAGADPDDLRAVRSALPDCPLVVGSGVTPDNLAQFAPAADGYIVGTYFKRSISKQGSDIDSQKVARLVSTFDSARPAEGEESK